MYIYSGWSFIFSSLAIIGFVCIIVGFSIEHDGCKNYEDIKILKTIYMVLCCALSICLFCSSSKEGWNYLDTPRSEYLIQASCSMNNENYTIFKTEHGEYKVEGTYEYGKDYILLMEDRNGWYYDDEVLNVYSSDINLLMQKNEKEQS